MNLNWPEAIVLCVTSICAMLIVVGWPRRNDSNKKNNDN
jgi:hypothetical protein